MIECILLSNQIAFETTQESQALSRFVIVDDYDISGGGIITSSMDDNQTQSTNQASVLRKEREALLNQKGAVLWFTGLSWSSKSTIAYGIEKELIR